jgi:ribonuclease HI
VGCGVRKMKNELMIHVWTDGSWNNINKDMGIGIYAIYNGKAIQYSSYIGKGTNNIAELAAIKFALKKLMKYHRTPIMIFTDSKYCIGVLTLEWKAKANIKLIHSIKRLIKQYDNIKFDWVKGHSNCHGNQVADQIAVEARKRGK